MQSYSLPLFVFLLINTLCPRIVSAQQTETIQTPKLVGDLVVRIVDEVEVPALESGPITELKIEIGQTVVKGELLAQLDATIAQAQSELAETEWKLADARFHRFRADQIAKQVELEKREMISQQQSLSEISKAKSGNDVRIAAAQRAEAVAQNEWVRATKAREKFVDAVSDSELENLRLQYEKAQLERMQATFEKRLDRIQFQADQSGVAIAKIAAQRSEIEQKLAASEPELLKLDAKAKADARQLHRLSLRRHQVLAPMKGQIVEIYHRQGEWVRPGEPIVRIVNLDRLYAEGFLKDAPRPKRMAAVQLVGKDQTVKGRVVFVSPEKDALSGEYRFLVEFAGGSFLPGEHVDIQW